MSTSNRGKLVLWTIRAATTVSFGLVGFAIFVFEAETFPEVSQVQAGQPGGKGQPGMKGQPREGLPGFGGFGSMGSSLESVKTQIKATDEEWKVIGPKLREVIVARRTTELGISTEGSGQRGGFGGPAGPGGFGPPGGGPGGFGPPGGPGGFGPPGGGGPGGGGPGGGGPGGPPPSFLDALNLTAEQKPQVETLQKELDTKLAKVLTEEQSKQLKEMREGRGGFGFPPPAGPIVFQINLDRLKLTADQKGKVETVLKEIDGKFAKILSEKQNKQLMDMREALSRFGQGRPPGFGGGGGPPGFGGSGPPGFGGGGGAAGDSVINQALNELQTAIDDSKTTPVQLNEKVAAVRAARKKAREKLDLAQKDLLLLLTPEQEAVLVRLGYLD
jgi:Spy/CpxP family protein refolding chaperone